MIFTVSLCLQSLREALRHEDVIRNDKHILSFSLYELAMIQISRGEVSYLWWAYLCDVHLSLLQYARARNTLSAAKVCTSG